MPSIAKTLWLGFFVVVFSAYGLERISDRTEPPGRVHVVYWEKWSGFEFAGIKEIVDDYNRSQDRIWVDLQQVGDVEHKTMFAISAGIPPDLAGLYSPNVPQYADERAVLPLDDLCRRAGIEASDYIPAYWQLMTYGGHIWALPTTPASTALHYNTDMLRDAGFDPAMPPKTIEQMDAMTDKISVVRNGHIEKIGFLPGEPGWWNWSWGYFFGGKLWDGVSRITTDTPENVRAFEWIQSFSKRFGADAITSYHSGQQFNSPTNGFMAGTIAMEMQGVWMHNFLVKFGPQIHANAAPFPYPEDRPDLANTTVVDSDVLVIPRGARHVKEAFEFVRYVQRQDVMEKLCLLHQKNSPLANVSEHFWKVHGNPWIRVFDSLARSRNAVLPPRVGIWPEFQLELSAAFDSIVVEAKTPRQALADVRTRLQPRLDEYQARLRRRRELGL